MSANTTDDPPAPVDEEGGNGSHGAATDEDAPGPPSAATVAGPEGVGEPGYSPPYAASGIALGTVLLTTVGLAVVSFPAGAAAALGAWTTGVALVRGRERLATGGAAFLLLAVILAGVQEVPRLFLLAGAVGTAVVFDATRYSVRLGHQIGRQAPTRSAELVHIAATAVVATGAAATGFVVFLFGTGGQSTTALVALLVAAFLLMSGLYLTRN